MVASASRRDTPIVAWHAVPGKACPGKEPSRRVRYDRAHPIPEAFFAEMCAVFSLKRLNTLLERFMSGDVRATARCNGAFSEPARYQVAMERIESEWRIAQHKFEAFYRCAIESMRIPLLITPYPNGTALWGRRCPGTSCQATIVPCLRDISKQALASRDVQGPAIGLVPFLKSRRFTIAISSPNRQPKAS